MKALILNCTLKASRERTNTGALTEVVGAKLRQLGVEVDEVRAVAGVVVTGNEDGAHHVISEISGARGDAGFTVPGQAWTYWNRGPGPGQDYLDCEAGHEWSHSTGEAAAANLHAVASALAARPIPAPPS